MTIVNDRMTVTLPQAAALIVANPNNRFLLRGEPGIGKSSLTATIKELTGMDTAYIDVPNMDLGDIAMPVIDHETKTTRYYPNARFGLHEGKPRVILLDEYTKGAEPVRNMLHPMIEWHNPRLGDIPLPAGTIVFMTGNLASDGVGDGLLAHTQMRVTEIEVLKPNADLWLAWAADNGIDPIVMAWVARNPDCLASYRDGGQENNPYIFNPNKVQGAVLTPRTLALSSNLIKNRDKVDPSALEVALAGTGGAPFASSISHFIMYQKSMTPWADIMANPETAKVPDSDGALAVMVFSAIERIKDDNEMTAFMKYVRRMDEEMQCVFCIRMARDKRKQGFIFKCREFAKWAADNQDLI